MIRFLLKCGIMLCLLCIILSFFLPEKDRQSAGGNSANINSANIFAAMAAVGSLVRDMDGFCARNPQSCETGKSFFSLMGEKAKQGAGFAAQWLGAGLSKGGENTKQHLTAADAARQTAPKTAQRGAAKPQNQAAVKQRSGKTAQKSAADKQHSAGKPAKSAL